MLNVFIHIINTGKSYKSTHLLKAEEHSRKVRTFLKNFDLIWDRKVLNFWKIWEKGERKQTDQSLLERERKSSMKDSNNEEEEEDELTYSDRSRWTEKQNTAESGGSYYLEREAVRGIMVF